MATSPTLSCALHEFGLQCWGANLDKYPPPEVVNPKAIYMGEFSSCVIDQEGLKCWQHADATVDQAALLALSSVLVKGD